MLKDRRVLIEHDLNALKEEASKLYLEMVTSNSQANIVHYEQVRSKIADLQLDLSVINQIIERG